MKKNKQSNNDINLIAVALEKKSPSLLQIISFFFLPSFSKHICNCRKSHNLFWMKPESIIITSEMSL